ncbi:hypothetical protein [Modestobacter sp. VKM Ac-2978]|uniref:hypothetical protein n=1 Tax=Modestobacter sp. VKM Ac-2978 TaxID=3004132 RepID=UPI0022AB0518|nr:hypothetical protein [Modestobacter sp. VKM Ac-2978]
MHLTAAALCVVAAAVMLVCNRHRHRHLRRAHLVVLAAMVVSALAMESPWALAGCTLALIGTGLVLALPGARTGQGALGCAIDVAGSGVLMALMAAPVLVAAATTSPMTVHAAHHHGSGVTPGPAGYDGLLALLACGAVAAWWLARRRVAGRAVPRPPRSVVADVAGGLMMVGMGAMAAM